MISIYTIILPRLEVFFLQEWIEHHLMIGVDKIYIYENGSISVDSGPEYVFDNSPGVGVKWAKKPQADYFQEYDDDQIKETLYNIVNQYQNVYLKEWHYPYRDHGTHAQLTGYVNCVESNKSDWWMFIDPDEYILPKKHRNIREFLDEEKNRQYSAFRLLQRVFDERERGKKVREIVNWGYDSPLEKSIIRSSIRTYLVHKPVPEDGRIKMVPRDEIIFHHYRGHPGDQGGPFHRIPEFLNSKFDKIDTSMPEFINTFKNNTPP